MARFDGFASHMASFQIKQTALPSQKVFDIPNGVLYSEHEAIYRNQCQATT